MRVLLVADVPGWAWSHKADAIKEALQGEFESIDKIYRAQFHSDVNKYLSEYDSVHAFGWYRNHKYAKSITSAVASYHFLTYQLSISKSIMPNYLALTSVCDGIHKELRNHNLNRNIYYAPNGVDTNKFYPIKKSRDKKFRIGWIGKISHRPIGLRTTGPADLYGSRVLRALEENLSEYKDIEFVKFTKTYKTAIPHEEMVHFYNKCDCQIDTSFLTGTPNPVFEAAACGKPIICTAVGEARNMVKNNHNGYLIDPYIDEEGADASVNKFIEKILLLKNDRDLCDSLGNRSRKIIESYWDWGYRAQSWLPIFKFHPHKKPA